jgi:type I restriction enzyme S subunit
VEIGRIPKEWEVARLGDISNQRNEIVQPDQKGNDKFVGLEHLEKGETNIKAYGLASGVISSKFRFFPRDILYGKLRPYLDKAVIADFAGICSTDLVVIDQDKKKVYPNFLIYIIHSQNFISHAISTTSGTNHPRTSWKAIAKFRFGLPPLPEQKKVAEILSTVDQAIEKVDKAIEKTQRLKKGLMQELLTRGIGHKEFKDTEIGGIPKAWKIMKLGEIGSVRYGLGQPPALEINGIPMIRATNVKRGKIVKEGLIFISPSAVPNSRDPFLRVGDILVVRSGAYTGDAALVTKEWEGAVAGYDLIVTPSDTIDSQFLTYYLLSSSVQKRHFVGLKVRSAQPHLNSSQVEETPIPIPPLPEQRRIAGILGTVDERLELLRKRKERLKRTKKGLMDDLLTARKRVRLEA